ncbi:MAG: glycosyltransferase family 4 protein [Bryobacteraceae bacterium]|nr:glycosyltransferase family 4 protein [Bryobacteraceae bacterium]
MTVGFFSPLPPAKTGVADYSAALLDALKREVSVRVGSRACDVALYHLGNNRLHNEIYSLAIRRPGVVVLHDAVLHHFLLGRLTEEEYVAEFVFNYGAWSLPLARSLWRERARSAADPRYFEYPMLRRIAESSMAVIVHNPAAASAVRKHAPNAQVYEVPHLFPEAVRPSVQEVAAIRSSLGIPSKEFLFAVFGHLRESKRLSTVLRVFRRMRREGENVGLLIAGDFASSDLERSLSPWLSSPGIYRVGYTPARLFWTLAAAADACINLRYPTAGETSGITIRLMGIGKPVLLTSAEENSRYPEAACIRIDAGLSEEDMLATFMRWLARFPGHAREIGARAQQYIAVHHSPAVAAARYAEVLQNINTQMRASNRQKIAINTSY